MLLYTALVQLNYRWATHWSQKNLLLLCTSSIYRYTLFLHPFSRSLFYPISICDSPPFDTPSFHSTLLLYAPYPTSSLSSHSTYNSLTHPTLRLPLFTPSLHSFTTHTPSISSSLHPPLHPFLQLVQLNRRWAPHWSQDNPPIWLTPLYHSISIVLHPFTTPLLYPISTPYLHLRSIWLTPLWHSLSYSFPLHTPSLYSTHYLSSSLPSHSTTPFYN